MESPQTTDRDAMLKKGRRHDALGVGFLVVLAASTPAWADAPPRVHLRGSAHLDARTARASGKVVLSGTLRDDAGKPLGQARVIVSALDADASPAPFGAPAACEGLGLVPIVEMPTRLALPTNDAGAFCVQVSLPGDRATLHLEAAAGKALDAANVDVSVDLRGSPIDLRFDPEPAVIDLGGPPLDLEVASTVERDGTTTAAAGLPLVLANELRSSLASGTTTSSGRARFALEAVAAGPAGRGRLTVAFAGNAEASPSSRVAEVVRRAAVELSAPDARDGALPAGCAEDGVAIRIVAAPSCARRGCVAAVTGTVEAFVDGAVVGAAPIGPDGTARVVATFAGAGSDAAEVRLRYVPDVPWLVAPPELDLALPLRPPSPWRRLPLFAAAALAIGWLALARWPVRAPRRRTAWRAPHEGPVTATVEVLRVGGVGDGWRGRVVDAHEGTALAGARVAIERRGFREREALVEARSEADGAFVLPAVEASPGDELVAEAPLHAHHRLALPAPGDLRVALVTRRRALVDRLVAWARRRGAPFDVRPEPSPAQVRRAAGADLSIARWADEVERAAFGGREVDAEAESAVERLAPDARHPSPRPEER